ncbi:MAG: aminopeptidase P family protein [Deltaproteobacteria bacterium]|nr:MAG: aminopeptidase P family protein [Deltaproteobacteria bacterium]
MVILIENRLAQLRKSIAKENIDGLLVLVAENRHYLSGFTGEDTQFDESAGALIISDANLTLATDSRYELQAKNEASLYEVTTYKESLAKKIPQILDGMQIKTLGFESNRISYKQYNDISRELKKIDSPVKLKPTENLVENLRIIKTDPEIDAIKASLSIAESAFTDCLQIIRPGITERENAWEMEKRLREAGADSLSFPIIVAAGSNSALPHAIPGSRKIKAGEPLLFDWGVKFKGYCSDISRTVVIGKPDKTFEKVFQTVFDAQRMAIDAVKPGISSKAVDEIARNYINARGFEGKFGHGLGHGTGLAIHEAPRLSPIKDIPLQIGMVSTIEPGIYLPGWGGVRLENMIVVRKDGAEVLNGLDVANYQLEI